MKTLSLGAWREPDCVQSIGGTLLAGIRSSVVNHDKHPREDMDHG
jgi:hypothetical protein